MLIHEACFINSKLGSVVLKSVMWHCTAPAKLAQLIFCISLDEIMSPERESLTFLPCIESLMMFQTIVLEKLLKVDALELIKP